MTPTRGAGAPPSPAIDVKRLARAYAEMRAKDSYTALEPKFAERLAREYDRLAGDAGVGPDRCPAAKHHRVRRMRSGGMVAFTEDGAEYAPDSLESDTCTACGFDFAALAEPAPAEAGDDPAEGVRRVKDIERRGYNPPYPGLVMNDPDAGL